MTKRKVTRRAYVAFSWTRAEPWIVAFNRETIRKHELYALGADRLVPATITYTIPEKRRGPTKT